MSIPADVAPPNVNQLTAGLPRAVVLTGASTVLAFQVVETSEELGNDSCILSKPRDMSQRPRVSAIVTAYNGAEFIADAIESILAQTQPVDEIVVIDDGSIDNTADIAESYRSRGVRCIRQENRGLPGARNRGIAETTGDFIAFLDCDDSWLPEKNAVEVQYLVEHPEVALVTGHAWWWNPSTGQRWMERVDVAGRSNIAREILVNNCVGNASAALLRRRTLEDVGAFDPKQIWAEDWELWMRIMSRARIGFLDRPVIVYRVVSTSLTHQRTWDRVSGYYQLSRQAIRNFRPIWWRHILFARAWSKREFGRTAIASIEGHARQRYLRHAICAFVSYPFERPIAKIKHIVRALGGPTLYKRYQFLRRARSRPQPPCSTIAGATPSPTDANPAG
jgi:glycosyltransferase involved in cell wall biosynthesis